MLNTPSAYPPTQLWAVVSAFHMGEFVKGVFEARHINASSVAKEMKVLPTSMPGYFNSKVIKEDVLLRMSNALKFDLLGMVREEQARRTVSAPALEDRSSRHDVAEPSVAYRTRPAAAPDKGLVLMINLADYSEESQLKILRFIQTQEKANMMSYKAQNS
jgi:hypothetical protein